MVHGPVLTRERARLAARPVSDTMLERSVPHLFSSFFFSIPRSSRRALASDISSYILAISILFTIFFFPSLLQPSHLLVFFFFFFFFLSFPASFTSATFLPSNPPSPFSRAISPRYVPDNTLSRIYAFLSLLPLTYPCLFDKISAVICERINFIVRKEQVLKCTYDAVVFIRN